MNRNQKAKSKHKKACKRNQKKLEKARREINPQNQHRQTYENILTTLGAGSWYRGLRSSEQDGLSRHRRPSPTLAFDVSTANGPDVLFVAHSVNEILSTPLASGITPNDWYSVGISVPSGFAEIMYRHKRPSQSNMDAEKNLSRAYDAFDLSMSRYIEIKLIDILIFYSSFDRGLYWCKLQLGSNLQSRLQLTLGRTMPVTVPVLIDGESRPAYRCGMPMVGADKVRWISWPASIVGVNDGPEELPVYIQSHAICRLHERINLPGGGERTVNGFLILAVVKPNFIQHVGDDFWIEYKLGSDRVGYLIARRFPDKIVIRTFVFLTMQGTPEAKLLFEKLRLRRPDIEYNRLDRLSTFLQSDICNDPAMCEILAECACGHLPSLAIKEVASTIDGTFIEGYAANLRHYLGIEGNPMALPRLAND